VVSPDFVRILQCPEVCWITLQVTSSGIASLGLTDKTAATGVIFSCNKTIEDVGSLWYILAEVFSQYTQLGPTFAPQGQKAVRLSEAVH